MIGLDDHDADLQTVKFAISHGWACDMDAETCTAFVFQYCNAAVMRVFRNMDELFSYVEKQYETLQEDFNSWCSKASSEALPVMIRYPSKELH